DGADLAGAADHVGFDKRGQPARESPEMTDADQQIVVGPEMRATDERELAAQIGRPAPRPEGTPAAAQTKRRLDALGVLGDAEVDRCAAADGHADAQREHVVVAIHAGAARPTDAAAQA